MKRKMVLFGMDVGPEGPKLVAVSVGSSIEMQRRNHPTWIQRMDIHESFLQKPTFILIDIRNRVPRIRGICLDESEAFRFCHEFGGRVFRVNF